MKKFHLISLFALTCSATLPVHAEAGLLEGVVDACKSEIESYCNQVTLGEGRLLACFYAHEDKLSTQCQYGLYKAASTLEQVVNTFAHIAESCETDIATHCSDIQPGEGRVLLCLKDKEKSVSEGCGKALAQVEIE